MTKLTYMPVYIGRNNERLSYNPCSQQTATKQHIGCNEPNPPNYKNHTQFSSKPITSFQVCDHQIGQTFYSSNIFNEKFVKLIENKHTTKWDPSFFRRARKATVFINFKYS